MALYIDDYGILDTHYIVHAVPINPCAEHGQDEWLIGLILHVGHQGYQAAQAYPTRALRDQAFEQLCGLMRRQAALEALDEDND